MELRGRLRDRRLESSLTPGVVLAPLLWAWAHGGRLIGRGRCGGEKEQVRGADRCKITDAL